MQRAPVARRPRHKRKRQSRSHQRAGTQELRPIHRPPPAHHEHERHGDQNQRRFRTHQRTQPDNSAAEKPVWIYHRGTLHRVGIDFLAGCGMEEGQQRQSSEKRRQDFGEQHSGIVGNEWTRRREPQRGNRDPPTLRFRGEKAGERSSQEASEQIERGLCEHDCKRSAAEQRVDRGQKSRIARHAQVYRGQLPADKQAVHVMIEPVAR